MSKFSEVVKYRKRAGRGTGRRFYTSVDMSVLKLDAAVRQSQVNRGEISQTQTQYIAECGCGLEGCFIHGSAKPST